MGGRVFFVLAALAVLAQGESGADGGNATTKRNRRQMTMGMFGFMSFPNTECTSDSGSPGTCYTASECAQKLGAEDGTCAMGMGVCCVFVINCGGSTAENNSFLVQAPTSVFDPAVPLTYEVCPSDNSVCRIRLEFITFKLAEPVTGAVETDGSESTTTGGSLGHCATDSFCVTSPGGPGTPVICGDNTGQHMVLDASRVCHKVDFSIGASTLIEREWNIKMITYSCGDTNGGPPGCLQYFKGTSGTVSSFNFPITSAIGASATHLCEQRYSSCFRRETGYCSICLWPAVVEAAATASAQSSFGLSLSGNAAVEGSSDCNGDYIMVAMGQAQPVTTGTPAAITQDRFCGRIFGLSSPAAATIAATICTQSLPFMITFVSDSAEATAPLAGANNNEQSMAPGGIVGFSLAFQQQQC